MALRKTREIFLDSVDIKSESLRAEINKDHGDGNSEQIQ